jgi:hypothetical protein
MTLRSFHSLTLAAALTVFASLGALPSAAMSFADLMITEILSSPGDPTAGETPFDANNDGINDDSFLHLSGDEFIEIWNSGSTSLDLTGLQIFDAHIPAARYTFDSVTLEAGAYFVIFGNSADLSLFTASAADLIGTNPAGCELCASNSGDAFTLRQGDGTIIDTFAIPTAFPGESFTRNALGDIVRHTDLSIAAASPGTAAMVAPEPATAVMLGLGLFGCGVFGRRRR